MKPPLLSREELIQHFATAQEGPVTPLLEMLAQQFEDKNATNVSAAIVRALQQSRSREPILPPPQELLPPLA